MISYVGRLPPTKLFNGHTVLQDNVTNQRHYVSTTIVSMATKICRMVAYLDGLLPIK